MSLAVSVQKINWWILDNKCTKNLKHVTKLYCKMLSDSFSVFFPSHQAVQDKSQSGLYGQMEVLGNMYCRKKKISKPICFIIIMIFNETKMVKNADFVWQFCLLFIIHIYSTSISNKFHNLQFLHRVLRVFREIRLKLHIHEG